MVMALKESHNAESGLSIIQGEGLPKMFNHKIAFLLFVMAALMPGSCSIIWVGHVTSEVSSDFNRVGLLFALFDLDIYLNLIGFVAMIYFGVLVARCILNPASEVYYHSTKIAYSSVAIACALPFWIYMLWFWGF